MTKLAIFICVFFFGFRCLAQLQKPPKTYAVIVGISEYENRGIEDLQFANKDAIAFADFLKSKAGGSVPPENMKLFVDETATNAAIYNSLSWLVETVEANDLVYIYFAGHGDMESETAYKLGFLLTYQTPRRTFINNALRIEDLNNYANTLALKAKVIVITDACHSGSLISSNKQLRSVVNNQLSAGKSKVIRIASCRGDQLSMEDEFWGGGRGVFSYYLVNGMLGFAEKNNDGIISIYEIKNYLDSALAKDSFLLAKAHKQNPVLNANDTVQLAVINKTQLVQLQQQIVPPAPIVSNSTNTSELSGAELLATILNLLKQEYAEQLLDFSTLKNTPQEKLLGEVLNQIKNKLLADTGQTILYSFEKQTVTKNIPLLQNKLSTDQYLWKQFNYDLMVLLDIKTQQVINDYLEGDAAELERRRYYNQANSGYDAYPHMFQLAMKLAANNKPLYDIFELKYYYFSGVALRLKIPTVENPIPLIDAAFAAQQKAVLLDPNAPYVHNELGTLYLYKQDLKLSEKHYKEAIDISPDWVLPWANLMGLYLATKDTTKALEAYTMAKKIQPDFQGLFVNNGILNEQKNNFLIAEEMFRRSIKLNSRHYFPFERLGYVYMQTTSYAQADSFFYEADIRKRGYHFNPRFLPFALPKFVDDFSVNALCELDTAAILENDAIGYFAWGRLNYNVGNFIGAEAKFKRTIALQKNNPLAFHHLGKLLYEQKRWQEADLVINFAINYYLTDSLFTGYIDSIKNHSPNNVNKDCAIRIFYTSYYKAIEDHYYLGTLYEQWNHFTEAEAQYRTIIKQTPNFIGGYYYLWNMLEKINRYEEAEKIIYQYKNENFEWGNRELRSFYIRMMKLFPSNQDWFFKAGSFLYQLAADNPATYKNDLKTIHPDESIPSMVNKRVFPHLQTVTLPFAHQTFQLAASILHPYTEAIEFFLKADSLIDKNELENEASVFQLIEINDHLGDLYVWQGLKELAGKHYEKAIGLQPSNTGIRLKTIEVHDANYHFSNALFHLEVLAEKKEMNYAKEVLLAKYYIHASNFKEGLIHLKNAEKIHPYKMAEIKNLYGRLALLSNKQKDAIKYYKEYLMLQPNDAEAMYSIARMYAKTGNKSEAWKWLKNALDHGFLYNYVLQFDSYWDVYRKDAKWKKLLSNYQMKKYFTPTEEVFNS